VQRALSVFAYVQNSPNGYNKIKRHDVLRRRACLRSNGVIFSSSDNSVVIIDNHNKCISLESVGSGTMFKDIKSEVILELER
jgi:hypothetical protein